MYSVNPYDFGQGMESVIGGAAAIVLLIVLVVFFLALACGITLYVFNALGMYTIAKRRGIYRPWLSWIPVTNAWVLGSISDQYQYLTKGAIRSRRKLLLGLEIARCAAILVMYIWYIVMLVQSIGAAFGGSNLNSLIWQYALGNGGISLAISALAIVSAVFQYIAYYDLFLSCNPGQSTVFLVLSILFPILMPIFVFCCRKKDLGMPPRNNAAQQPINQPVYTAQPVYGYQTVYEPQPVYEPAPQPVYTPEVEPEVITPQADPQVVEAQDEDFED